MPDAHVLAELARLDAAFSCGVSASDVRNHLRALLRASEALSDGVRVVSLEEWRRAREAESGAGARDADLGREVQAE